MIECLRGDKNNFCSTRTSPNVTLPGNLQSHATFSFAGRIQPSGLWSAKLKSIM